MVCPMFQRDYEAMTAAGVKFTPADIIRLNALALKAKLAARPFQAAHIRRAVFLDAGGFMRRPLVLSEPTIAHLVWLEEVEAVSATLPDLAWYALVAFALSRDAKKLPPPIFPAAIRFAVERFAKRLRNVTKSQLADAVEFALNGSDWTNGERAPRPSNSNSNSNSLPAPDEPESPAIGAVLGAIARRLPISLAEARTMTESELLQAIGESRILDHDYSVDNERNKALGDYYRARDEIKKRNQAT